MPERETALPEELEAERHVLRAILDSPAAIETTRNAGLVAEDFLLEAHRVMYGRLLALHDGGRGVDIAALGDALEREGELGAAGGRERLDELLQLPADESKAAHHAQVVRGKARARRVAESLGPILHAATNGAELDASATLAAIDKLRAELDAEEQRSSRASIASLDDFLSRADEHADPLLGTPSETILSEGGLVIVGGEGGSSKTTLTLDAVAHLASGTTWLGVEVARPVRILLIENEGPRQKFREKLQAKLDSWEGAPWSANVYVWEEPWTGFSFARQGDRATLRRFAREKAIDLVGADPLDSLGVIGAGKPEETREFIGWLQECGLFDPISPLAFWILHHFSKAPQKSVVQQLSGAWGGHPDTIFGLELGDGQTTKFTWGKQRWATPPKERTQILAWNLETKGFTPIEKPEGASDDVLHERIAAYLAEHPWSPTNAVQTVQGDNTRISNLLKKGAATGLYTSHKGAEHPGWNGAGNAILWRNGAESDFAPLQLSAESTES